jgi:hypothetical protein
MPLVRCAFCGRALSGAPHRGWTRATRDQLAQACVFRARRGTNLSSPALHVCPSHDSEAKRATPQTSVSFDEACFHSALRATGLVHQEDEVRALNVARTVAAPPAPQLETMANVAADAASLSASSASASPSASSTIWELVQRVRTKQDAEVSLSPRDEEQIRAWVRLCDFHNNYGCDLVELPPEATQLATLVMTRGDGMQSSGSVDDLAAANILLEHIKMISLALFPPFIPLTFAAHTSDLLLHVVSAEHVRRCRGPVLESVLPARPAKNTAVQFLALPKSYYEMGFVVHSHAMRCGLALPLHTIKTDASFVLGGAADANAEKVALKELHALLLQLSEFPRVMIVEPFLIPGGGRIYSTSFCLELQKLCIAAGVPIVADETLSMVRCGHLLYSNTIAGFKPDYVLLGKSLGCGMLLVRSTENDLDVHLEQAFSNAASALSLVQVACTLALVQSLKLHEHCATEGAKMLTVLQRIVGDEHVRGLGLCLWLTPDGLDCLPIHAAVNGRLLPRIDQTAATFAEIVHTQARMIKRLRAVGDKAMEKVRSFYNCARCGDQCRRKEKCLFCSNCPRQWHVKCLSEEHVCPCFEIR